jgi:precorrin-2/cobalt-factor-2 C20-methyltransferase
MGTFYGIGVGPGDPSLITVKAVDILRVVDEVYTATTSTNEESLAGKIASPYLRPGVKLQNLIFPMTNDVDKLEESWQANAQTVAATLDKGHSVAFLTLGDCLTYSTYAYLLRFLLEIKPTAKVESIPGITSYQLAAARLNRPLVLGKESLSIMGGSIDHGFNELCQASDNLVILKPYRGTSDILDRLKAMGLADKTAICSNLALKGETIIDGLDKDYVEPDGYFSLLLINKRLANKDDS